MSETITWFETVSFWATPLEEVSAKHAELRAAGWGADGRLRRSVGGEVREGSPQR